VRPGPLVLGAVLAGGESRRLGRDKASEQVAGERMVDRAVAALRAHCAEVVVVSSRADTPSGDWSQVPDLRVGLGPLAGIEAALDRAASGGASEVFVLACDLPLVDSGVVGRVIEGRRGARAAALARDGEPSFEPLCAVYSVDCLAAVRALLDEGARAAGALFRVVEGRRVPAGIRGVGVNVNDEDGLRRARALAAGESV
jgi:molybdopterin-guanine dinucleotide biosynthesis protein A